MTDFEYACLQALVDTYGAAEVIDSVKEIANVIEEPETLGEAIAQAEAMARKESKP